MRCIVTGIGGEYVGDCLHGEQLPGICQGEKRVLTQG